MNTKFIVKGVLFGLAGLLIAWVGIEALQWILELVINSTMNEVHDVLNQIEILPQY